jgi:NAD-dependent DNA ligase
VSAGQKAQTRPKRSRDSKRQALQEYPNLGDSAVAAAEYEKHANRLAQLERAKELALADQRTDVSQKVDTLMAQENKRHQNWLTQHPPTPQGNTEGTSQGAAQ